MFRIIRRHPGKVAALVTALAAAGLLLWRFHDRLDADRWIAYGDHLPLPVLLVAFLVLPLAGVPVSIFLVLAGMQDNDFAIPGVLCLACGLAFLVYPTARDELARARSQAQIQARAARSGE